MKKKIDFMHKVFAFKDDKLYMIQKFIILID